jgi:hypothetical protein
MTGRRPVFERTTPEVSSGGKYFLDSGAAVAH